MRIEAVTQGHGMGCGVACVAAVLGVGYEEARALFERPEQAHAGGYLCRDLVWALGRAGRTYRHKYLRSRRDPVLRRPGTIVFTRFSKAYPRGHYLVRAEGGWMNPWANYPWIAPARSELVARLPAAPVYAIFAEDFSREAGRMR